MPLEQLTLSDEQVQDIVASLITGGGGSDVAYDDTNDTLTVSLSDSISVNTLEATAELGNPTYPTLSDVPTNYPKGHKSMSKMKTQSTWRTAHES